MSHLPGATAYPDPGRPTHRQQPERTPDRSGCFTSRGSAHAPTPPPTCRNPGCNQLTPCPTHGRDSDRDRERNGQRYTPAMRRAAATIRAGAIGQTCPRCGLPIQPGQRVQAGHSVDRVAAPGSLPDRPEHAACNEAAGGKTAHRV